MYACIYGVLKNYYTETEKQNRIEKKNRGKEENIERKYRKGEQKIKQTRTKRIEEKDKKQGQLIRKLMSQR